MSWDIEAICYTIAEKELCWLNPIRCIGVYNASVEAEEWAISKNTSGAHNGIQDALRHTMWNALKSYDYGKDYDKQWGDAHESESTEENEVEMDFHNNSVGREIGENFKEQGNPRSDLGDEVINALNQGILCTSLSDC